MGFKKLVVACLALGFFFLLPVDLRAETPAVDEPTEKVSQANAEYLSNNLGNGEQQAAVSLEQAIITAKETFPVPGQLDRFSTGYNQSDKNSFWELRWYCSSEPGGNMNISVDTETGEIWSMYRWLQPEPGKEYKGLPKFTKEEAKITAVALVEKIQPERFKETRLQPANDYFPMTFFKERGQIEYNYNFARVINGIPFPENGISVTVSGDTGEVIGFNVRWEDTLNFPSAAGRITPQRAEQVFRTDAEPELFYFRPHLPGGKEVPLKLVYRLPGLRNEVLINALTGELLNKDEELFAYDLYGAGGGAESRSSLAKEEAVNLTRVEECAVEEAKNLLSRDKALEMAVSLIKVPADFKLSSSRLEQDYMFNDKKSWHFNWQAGDNSNQRWMDVSVDAASGELVLFSLDRIYGSMLEQLEEPEVKYNEDDARKLAEEFIKKVQPGKFRQVTFQSCRPEQGPLLGSASEPKPCAYNLSYIRVENGIKFPDNGIYVTVNSTTGEITRFNIPWWNVDFPDSAGVMDQAAAAGRYLHEAPLTVSYTQLRSHDPWSNFEDAKIYLVYHLAERKFNMLDAFSGQPLDYEGEVVSKPGEARFTDLDGHPAREAVELLARSGIIAPGDGKFRPDDAVTQAELITMLVKSGSYPGELSRTVSSGGQEPWYQPYYNRAGQMGIIQFGEQPEPDQAVTREYLARVTIHAMGFYRVAKLGDLFVLNFSDAGEISEHLRGHAAISVGLGLIEPVEGRFNPKTVVTRGEAAITLLRVLQSEG